MNEVIRFDKISKSFESVERIDVLKEIDFTLNQGEFVAIHGKSGIGKSTFLHIAATLLEPSTGELSFFGKNVREYSNSQKDRMRAQKIGCIFQEFSFIQALSLIDNLKLIYDLAHPKSKGNFHKMADEYLERLKLGERKHYLPSNLSGGQKRRAMIIAGMIKEPDILLADEPTNDLDYEISKEVMNMMSEFTDSGKSILLVSHNPEITQFAKTHYTIDEGRLQVLKR